MGNKNLKTVEREELEESIIGKCDQCKNVFNNIKQIKIHSGNVLMGETRIILSLISEDLPRKCEKYLLDLQKGDRIIIELCRSCFFEIKKIVNMGKTKKKRIKFSEYYS